MNKLFWAFSGPNNYKMWPSSHITLYLILWSKILFPFYRCEERALKKTKWFVLNNTSNRSWKKMVKLRSSNSIPYSLGQPPPHLQIIHTLHFFPISSIAAIQIYVWQLPLYLTSILKFPITNLVFILLPCVFLWEKKKPPYQLPKPDIWDCNTSHTLTSTLPQCISKLLEFHLQSIHLITAYFIPYIFFFTLVQSPYLVYSIATFSVFMLLLLPMIYSSI